MSSSKWAPPGVYSNVLAGATFAAKKHSQQRRKDALMSPYINHALDVASLLQSGGGVRDDEVLVAALLHDVLEDTVGVEPTDSKFDVAKLALEEEIRCLFGDSVLSLVIEVTDDKKLPKEVRKQQQIEHARSVSTAAKLIKLADKICNLQDIQASPPVGWSRERRQQYFDWSKAVVDRLRGTHAGLEALFDSVHRLGPPPAAQYVAVLLNEPDRRAIFGSFPPRFELVQDGHVTLQRLPGSLPPDLGAEVRLRVIGYAVDEKAEALAVELEAVNSCNSVPHITLSVAAGVKPAYSNELLKNGYASLDPISVSGRIMAYVEGRGYVGDSQLGL